MDQAGPKEHLTGKMFDTVTGLYDAHARWYDPQVGRFVGRDPAKTLCEEDYLFCMNTPTLFNDPTGLKSSAHTFIFDDCCDQWFDKQGINRRDIINRLNEWIGRFASDFASFAHEVDCMLNTDVEITCENCADGSGKYCGYKRPGNSLLHLCTDEINTAKGVADTSIHEKAHVCGWKFYHPVEDPWKRVPVADARKGDSACDEQIAVEDHPLY